MMTRIINAPAKYIQGPGELKRLKAYCDLYTDGMVYILADPFIADRYQEEILRGFDLAKVTFTRFTGECSDANIRRHAEALREAGGALILGVGGGKTLDTTKAIGFLAKVPVLVAPTIASTDAPCSAISVIYTDEGQFDRYMLLPAGPNAVIVDEEVIAQAPARLLASGIGDALSTYYEADATFRKGGLTYAGGLSTNAALEIAKHCLRTLLADGEKAMLAAKNHVVTQAFRNVVEANTYLSGIGFESGGLAAAHAIQNGLAVFAETRRLPHGDKVAFGTLTQLVLENRPQEEIVELISFCKKIGLPTSFKALGIENASRELLYQAAAVANAEGSTMRNMPFAVTDDDIVAALYTVNEMGS